MEKHDTAELIPSNWRELNEAEAAQLFELLGVREGEAVFRLRGTGLWIRTAIYKDGDALVTRFAPDVLKVE